MSLNLLQLDWRRSDLPNVVESEVYWLSDAAKANESKRLGRRWKMGDDGRNKGSEGIWVIEFYHIQKGVTGDDKVVCWSVPANRRFRSCRGGSDSITFIRGISRLVRTSIPPS
jgi:hypothetical protein